ncbi:hypothetical protein F2Q69_00042191 [Brassica cretica]|uniref:Uncharacterized protein n=1 Tax=Brassica cretica TaxID=69181 RepID=A0A8S9NDP4_BRACR|nr:hypothetical protein F2Q69_00042191 [Brassica cretica]
MRSPIEFERAPDGGAGEVAVYEAYLEAGIWGVIPSLIGEVWSFFGFCPSQLTPLTWRNLMAIQVLGELHGFSVGVYEILNSYDFAPLMNKAGFYDLRSRDGTPLVEEPSRRVRGNYLFGDGWNGRHVFVKIQEPVGYATSWRTVVHPYEYQKQQGDMALTGRATGFGTLDENGMLRDEEGRTRNNIGQLINADGVVIPDVIDVAETNNFDLNRE